jgi:hypothetical protein
MSKHLAIVATLVLAAACTKDKPKEPPPAVTSEKKTVDIAKPADKPADKPAVAPAEPPAPKWEKYTSKEGKYTIDLPAKGEEQEQGGMKIVGATFGTTATDDRTAMCGVAYMDLPDPKADPKVMLDGATARHKQNAEVLEEKDITLDKNPGKSIVVKNSSHQKWMRVFIVDKKRIYVLNCGGPFDRAATDGPIATKALDSFALVK